MSHPALTSLRALTFFDTLPELDSGLRDWLLLEDSMTKRFEQFCSKVHVDIIFEGLSVRNYRMRSAPACRKSRATGCVKSSCAATASPG